MSASLSSRRNIINLIGIMSRSPLYIYLYTHTLIQKNHKKKKKKKKKNYVNIIIFFF